MSLLEEILGLKLIIVKDVDPSMVSNDSELMERLKDVIGFNSDEFFIFVHTINFFKRMHFRKKTISKIIEHLELSFRVNQRQQEKGFIRFYNNALNEEEQEDGVLNVQESSYKYTRMISGKYLDEHSVIRSRLITYISKDLIKEGNRKVKISIRFTPLNNKNRETKLTELDLQLDSSLKLNLRGLTTAEIREVHTTVSSQLNTGITPLRSVKMDRAAHEPLIPMEIDRLENKLRELGLVNAEIERLHELAQKNLTEKDKSMIQKKFAQWFASVADRSMLKHLNLDVDQIEITGKKILWPKKKN
jgi:hypothetical protein